MAAKKKATKKQGTRGAVRPRRNSPINEDTHKVEQSAASPTARSSRISDGRRVRRNKRGSVGGFRDTLTVTPREEGFYDKYVTKWVKDVDERGQRILYHYNNDWDYVTADEVDVGENFVYKSRGAESIVRVPAGTTIETDKWLFLMKKYRDWSEADQVAKYEAIDATEAFIDRKRDPNEKEEVNEDGEAVDGLYGEGSTEWENKVLRIEK